MTELQGDPAAHRAGSEDQDFGPGQSLKGAFDGVAGDIVANKVEHPSPRRTGQPLREAVVLENAGCMQCAGESFQAVQVRARAACAFRQRGMAVHLGHGTGEILPQPVVTAAVVIPGHRASRLVHPPTSRIHRPGLMLRPDQHDNRSVVPIEMAHVDQWQFGTVDTAASLVHLAAPEVFSAVPPIEPPPLADAFPEMGGCPPLRGDGFP